MINIRTATLQDIPTISYIHAASWRAAYKGIVPQAYLDELKDDFWVNSFTTCLSKNSIVIKLIEHHSKPIGCISYGKAREEAFSDWGEIVSFYLLPDYFHQGYGALLLASALDALKSEGYQKVYLWVLKDNRPARNFYGKHHFICTQDEIQCEIQGTPLVDVRYTLAL